MRSAEMTKIRWLIQLRWLAIVLFIVAGAMGFFFHAIPSQNFAPYMGLTSILVVFNLVSHLGYLVRHHEVNPISICFQLGFDLVILTAFLYFSHGVENPFIALFYVNACLGGLLIPGYLSLPFVLLIHALLATLQIEYFDSIPGAPNTHAMLLSFFVSHLLIFGCWLMMRSLGFYFERQSEKQVSDRVIIEKQDRLRALGALSAGFSHEFASPLNTAKIRLDRLSRAHAENEDVREAKAAIESCEQVLHQMNSSQVDTRSFAMKQVNLKSLMLDLIEVWKEDKVGVEVIAHIDEVGEIELPPVNFAQVLLNLLDNAYESSPWSHIQVSLVKDGKQNRLTVEDSGPGFAATVLERMGEPFVTTKEEGTGLGLYVSQLFAQSLGGELKIENTAHGAKVAIAW